jgi:chemotaxis protein CheY-P-specific phosphatase CheC
VHSVQTVAQRNEEVARVVQQGAHEAAAALSRLFPRGVAVVGFGSSDAQAIAQQHARSVVLLAFETSGGFVGQLVFVLDEDVAAQVATSLVGGADDSLTRTSMAALAEVGNIAASAFLNAAARVVGATCLPSTPRVSHAPAEQAVVAALPPSDAWVARLAIDDVGSISLAFTAG